ncbi:recombinase family protein [Salmonella enterica]|nr:recombinase family protein [Salmonella enterica]EAM9129375.1 recombinase family protein [Salmonella enterica]EAP0601235.1 recombinase family protein [Salmonella enterica]EAS2391111.1 recombinase family protein [Salmonella enterica]EAS2419022.1 recombinase family protein [Salmonella enterica]
MATIGYVRVSTDEQTTANQQQQIAERYNVDKWFSDEATSGTTAAQSRDGFKALMNYVREGDSVVVVAVDRVGRNTIDLLQTVEALKAKGVSLVSMREGFDLSTPAGEAMLTIMAALAKMELANLAERRAAGIKRAQSEGKHCGRPKKADAGTVKGLFEAGKTWQEIATITGLSKASIYRLKGAAE